MNKIVGVVDSGLGGLLVLEALKSAYPDYHYIYIGDQLHAPYGDCTKDELLQYGMTILEYFYHRQVQDVVIACNTLCANALIDLQDAYPNMRIHGIIDATCLQLKGISKKNILVLATHATVQKHAYRDTLKKIVDAKVWELACPKLVPMIEANEEEGALKKVLEDYLEPYIGNVDAVILGCTHYPIIAKHIQNILQVDVFDSNQAIIHELPFHNDKGQGKLEIYTTKDAERMHDQIKTIIKKDYLVSKLKLD